MLSKKYLFVKIRTNRKYIGFLICQFLLSLAIIIVGLTSSRHFRSPTTIALEIAIAVCMALDLIVRANSESRFWRSKGNILDMVVFACLIALIIYVSLTTKESEELVLEADDIILLVIVVSRYAVQIVRLGCMIKNSTDNMQMQKQLKEIDLNNPDLAVSKTHQNSEHQTHGSQQLRNKIMNFVMSNKEGDQMKEVDTDHAHKPLQEEV